MSITGNCISLSRGCHEQAAKTDCECPLYIVNQEIAGFINRNRGYSIPAADKRLPGKQSPRFFYISDIAFTSSVGVDTICAAPFSFRNSVDLNPQFTLIHGIPALAAV